MAEDIQQANKSPTQKSNTGLIIGGIVAVIIFVLVIFLGLYFTDNLEFKTRGERFVEDIEKEWEEDRIERDSLEESCKEIKFEIVSIGNCPASSTSCELVVKRLGGEIDPDKITVIVDDGSNLIGSRLRWDYEDAFNIGDTKTITVTNNLEKGKLAEEASTVQVYAYVSDPELSETHPLRETGCMTTEKIL
ncbi:hypothetical protein KAJ38_03350 [Candidatus Pacearchaeota archaeon]|nr:hypothetical protein [Candidatus Pacearchaeota archaeon]